MSMQIVYQGKKTETDATTVGGFLASAGIGAGEAVVEYNGEIVGAAGAATTPLVEGAELNAYRIVAGG